jgi:outer membrane receptor protein involved in Fe transport
MEESIVNPRIHVVTRLAALWILVSAWAPGFAGNTGKISGVITDAQQKTTLPGTNVLLEGTTLGAVTDDQGRYAILNVPPGLYRLRATMMGYRTVIVREVRVSIDLTTEISAAMTATTIESSEAVTITAERPLVQKDRTSSIASVNSDQIKDLPVQSVSDVLQLQSGVVRSGDGFHIRGGRASEVSYWVDGIATNEAFYGGNAVTVEKSAVQEMQVVSGTFNAEYGNAMSGVVNIITKEGGSKLEGSITAYAGDYMSGRDVYGVLRKVTPVYDPALGQTMAREDLENPLKKFNPTMNAEMNLTGPVPYTNNRLSFMVNGRTFSQEGYLYGRRWYYPQGIPGDSALVPLNPSVSSSGMAKLTFRATSKLKFNYSLFLNQYQSDRYYSQIFKYNPDGNGQGKGHGVTHMLGWSHVLSPKMFYEARLSRVSSHYENYVYQDSTLHPSYFIEVLADTSGPGYVARVDPNSAEGKALLEELNIAQRSYKFVADPANHDGYVHPDSASDPAAYSFRRAGTNLGWGERDTGYWIAKLDFTNQITPIHQLKAGIEALLHDISINSLTLQAKRKAGKDEQIVPFEPWSPPVSNINHDDYTKKPRELSAYLQDKIELKDMIVNVGVRFDYFDANAIVPVDPKDPNIYFPFQPAFKYRNPGAPDSLLEEYTPDERRAFMQKKVGAKTQVSPRIGIAYPITDRGIVHFSYGHFFKRPDFQWLYNNPDYKLYTGGGQNIIGNANLNAERTVQYEIGLQQQLSDRVGFNVSLFYKDIRDWVGTAPLQTTLKTSVAYSIYENKDYANVYGLVVDFEKRYANHFGVGASYSFQVAEGTYSNPNDAFNAIQNEQEPRLNLIPLNWDQRHTLMGTATAGFGGWTVTLQGKYQTGRPYTPTYAKGEQVGGSESIGFRDNSARLPTTSSLDVLVHKRFRVGSLDLGLLVTVYNVFDQAGETAVYAETGTAGYSANIVPSEWSYLAERVGTVQDLLRQPTWYIAPRHVQAGLTLEL